MKTRVDVFGKNPRAVFITYLKVMLFAIILIGGSYPFVVDYTIAKFELLFIVLFFSYRLLNQTANTPPPNLLTLSMFDKTSLLALVLLIATTTALNNDINNTPLKNVVVTYNLLFTTVHLCFIYCLLKVFLSLKIQLTDFIYWLPITIMLLALSYVFMHTTGIPFPLKEVSPYPQVPLSSNIRYLGYLVTASSMLCIIMFLQQEIERFKLSLWALLFVSNLALLIWLGGRGSLVALAASAFIYLSYFVVTAQLKASRLIILILLIIIAFYLAYFCTVFSWNGPLSFFRSVNSDTALASIDINKLSSNRIAIWTQTLAAISDNPWIGLGPEGYRFHPDHVFGLQPHNVLLQLLVGYGLFATLIMLYFYSKTVFIAIMQLFNRNNGTLLDGKIALMIIISLSIHGLVDGTFYHSQPLFLLIIAFVSIMTIHHSTVRSV